MSKPKYEIAQIIEQFGAEFTKKHKPNSYILQILNNLKICRTSALGGHKDKCDCCEKTRISYNSCRNRHCPKCQASKQAFWIEDTSERIIDTKYFHIVFTVPDVLNSICLLNSKEFYNTLFSSVWNTLHTFGYSHYAVETGAIAVLHTWGQNLSLHPHIHCLVPAAGMTLVGYFKKISKKGKYIYPVRMLSNTFRDNLMKRLKKQIIKRNQLSQYQAIIDKAWGKKWVVFCKPSFTNAEHIIKYIGQYTHRVAITNQRIISIDNESVSFFYKDYKDNSKRKPTVFSGIEFLRRFCMHILPKRFVKIRYYGILSSRYKKKTVLLRINKTQRQKETTIERIKRLTGFDIYKCPFCKNGKMHTIEIIPKTRSPDNFFIIKNKKCNSLYISQ